MTEKDRKRGSKVGKIAVFCVKVGSLADKVRALIGRGWQRVYEEFSTTNGHQFAPIIVR